MNLQEQVADYLLLKKIQTSNLLESYVAYNPSDQENHDQLIQVRCVLNDNSTDQLNQFKEWVNLVYSLQHPHLPQWIEQKVIDIDSEDTSQSVVVSSQLHIGIDLQSFIEKNKRRKRTLPLPHTLYLCHALLDLGSFLI